MKPFNIHFNPFNPGKVNSHYWGKVKRRGFSAVVTHSQYLGMCDVYFSFCSLKDEFNKKMGLSTARTNKFVTVHRKALPGFIRDLERECFGDGEPLNLQGHYNYLYKNFF